MIQKGDKRNEKKVFYTRKRWGLRESGKYFPTPYERVQSRKNPAGFLEMLQVLEEKVIF